MRDSQPCLLEVFLLLNQLSLLHLSQIFIFERLRPHVRGGNQHFLGQSMGPWHIHVFHQQLIDLSHLLWIQVFQSERLLVILIAFITLIFLDVIEWPLFLGCRLILSGEFQLHFLIIPTHGLLQRVLSVVGLLRVIFIPRIRVRGGLLLPFLLQARLLCHLSLLLLLSLPQQLSLQSSLGLLIKFGLRLFLDIATASNAARRPLLLLILRRVLLCLFDLLNGKSQLFGLLNLLWRHFGRLELALRSNLFDLFFSQTKRDIFRLKIRVDNLADSMQKVQADEALPGHLPNYRDWGSFIVVPLYNL